MGPGVRHSNPPEKSGKPGKSGTHTALSRCFCGGVRQAVMDFAPQLGSPSCQNVICGIPYLDPSVPDQNTRELCSVEGNAILPKSGSLPHTRLRGRNWETETGFPRGETMVWESGERKLKFPGAMIWLPSSFCPRFTPNFSGFQEPPHSLGHVEMGAFPSLLCSVHSA